MITNENKNILNVYQIRITINYGSGIILVAAYDKHYALERAKRDLVDNLIYEDYELREPQLIEGLTYDKGEAIIARHIYVE